MVVWLETWKEYYESFVANILSNVDDLERAELKQKLFSKFGSSYFENQLFNYCVVVRYLLGFL